MFSLFLVVPVCSVAECPGNKKYDIGYKISIYLVMETLTLETPKLWNQTTCVMMDYLVWNLNAYPLQRNKEKKRKEKWREQELLRLSRLAFCLLDNVLTSLSPCSAASVPPPAIVFLFSVSLDQPHKTILDESMSRTLNKSSIAPTCQGSYENSPRRSYCLAHLGTIRDLIITFTEFLSKEGFFFGGVVFGGWSLL